MWKPVSKLSYEVLSPTGQILVVVCPLDKARMAAARERWRDRGAAIAPDSKLLMRDIVRDLLANPQIRAIVFDGVACGRDAYTAFWAGEEQPSWRIDNEHLTLVRQFVDLYDDDCGIKHPMQPFWPARIMYLEDKCD